jgi:hypothetical protein
MVGMEKYFVVTEKSELRGDYLKYRENAEVIRQHVKDFTEEHGIESKEYHESVDALYIVPTNKDNESFGKMLAKDVGNGLRPFKKNSQIAKAWVNSLKEKNIEILHKPTVGFYFKEIHGRFRYRLFVINNIVYCSMSMDHDFETPEGMEEIKASEFFKVVEDHEKTA